MGEMIVARVVLGVVLVAAGVLLDRVARAAATGRLRRNHYAGIRTRATLASDEAWRAAHVRAERPARGAGLVLVATGLGNAVPFPDEALWVLVLVGTVVALGLCLYAVGLGSRAAREAAR